MTTGDTQPTRPLPPYTYAEPAPKRRRRAWPWVVALIVVAGLAIAAWFAGEWIARDVVTKTIREQVITQLSLPEDQPIDIVVQGAVLPQLIRGTLDDVTISSDDVELDAFAGDVTVHAQDIAIRGDADAGTATAKVVIDEEQLRTLLATVDNFPIESLGLAAPDVTMSTELSLFGLSLPVGVALTPSAVDGAIVLTPASLQLAGSDISAASLKTQFGGLAETVLRDWTICVAQYIPAGATLTGISVAGDEVVAELEIDPAIVTDTSLQEVGVCE
jgi:LmeA-like phospholipid-binding